MRVRINRIRPGLHLVPAHDQSYCDVHMHSKCDGRTTDDYDDCLCTCHPRPEET